MSKRPYTPESLRRALDHHVGRSALRSAKRMPTSAGRVVWHVDVPQLGVQIFTDAQCYALCIGLAASERALQSNDTSSTQPKEND